MANDIGTFISPTEASEYLLAFFNDNGLDPNDPTVVSGHLLGLAKIKELIQKIDAYNATNAANPIDAIRIYQARSTQKINGADQKVDDVFLIPVLSNGDDLYEVYPSETVSKATTNDTGSILGITRPCPNLCGT